MEDCLELNGVLRKSSFDKEYDSTSYICLIIEALCNGHEVDGEWIEGLEKQLERF